MGFMLSCQLLAGVYIDISQNSFLIQWTLITMTPFVPKDIAIKMNLLLYRILNEQIDM